MLGMVNSVYYMGIFLNVIVHVFLIFNKVFVRYFQYFNLVPVFTIKTLVSSAYIIGKVVYINQE